MKISPFSYLLEAQVAWGRELNFTRLIWDPQEPQEEITRWPYLGRKNDENNHAEFEKSWHEIPTRHFFMAGFWVVFRAKKWRCVQPADWKGTQRHHKKKQYHKFPQNLKWPLGHSRLWFSAQRSKPLTFQYTAWVTRDPYFMAYQLKNRYITGYTWSSLTTQRTTGDNDHRPAIHLPRAWFKSHIQIWLADVTFQNMVVQGVKKYETNTKNGTICRKFPPKWSGNLHKNVDQRFKDDFPLIQSWYPKNNHSFWMFGVKQPFCPWYLTTIV